VNWLIFAGEQVAGCIIGVVVGFFGVAQPVMILFAFIPWTLSLHREGALRNLAPLRRYVFAFTYLLLFLILASWLLVRYGAFMLPGYVLGLAYTLHKGINRSRQKLANSIEYLKMNADDFNPDYVTQVFGMQGGEPTTPKPCSPS
jgi:hypothetical protein